MSLQINTSNVSVNRYSDFKLQLSLKKDNVAYVPDQFIMAFYVEDWQGCDEAYMASLIGGEYTNCSISGNFISVYFNSPDFNIGTLKVRVLDMITDGNFSDGTMDVCTPITLPVQVVAGAGDTDTVVLGYGTAYFGDDHDLVFEGAMTPSFGRAENLII